jgi:hypothetical protein
VTSRGDYVAKVSIFPLMYSSLNFTVASPENELEEEL